MLDNNGNDVDIDDDDGDNQLCDPDIACRMTLKRNILLILLLLLLLLLLLPIFVLYFLTNDAVRIVLLVQVMDCQRGASSYGKSRLWSAN